VTTIDTRVITRDDQTIVEGTPGTQLLQIPDDIADIIGICFESHTRELLLYAENLTGRFFDLSSGEAGAILQKLRNYHIRLAVVLSPGGVRQSSKFGEMALEESKSGYFRLFEDHDSAEEWLVSK
jgi:hypothetical protein